MELDGPQQKQVREALKSAYPTRQDLERMVFDGLVDQRLREELSTLHLQSQEIRNRTRFVVSAAREARGDSSLAR